VDNSELPGLLKTGHGGQGTPNSEPKRPLLALRHELLKAVREFFYSSGYLEVETPGLTKNPPPDPNIDPLSVRVGKEGPFYLHTSPEMHMKKLLRYGEDRIFQLCKVYRVEEFREVHNVEFTMLEWYRKGTYREAIDETASLVESVTLKLGLEREGRFSPPFTVYDLQDLINEKTGIDPFGLDRDLLLVAMKSRGFQGIDGKDSWNDLFFKLFIQEVEPRLTGDRPYFIRDWPASISTMAKAKKGSKVERFELYIRGLEIANGYTELLDEKEQRQRFTKDNLEREGLGKDVFAVDEEFLRALSELKGTFAGVSVGIDRFLMALLGAETIDEVLVQRFEV
jgi:lysyl-tRNA synthetase class 2